MQFLDKASGFCHIRGMNTTLSEMFAKASKPAGTYSSSWLPLEVIAPKIPESEKVLIVMKGSQTDPGAFVTMVLTDKALHVLGKGTAFGNKITRAETYSFSQITGVSRDKKLLYRWTVTISRASNVDVYVNLEETESAKFFEILGGLVSSAQSGSPGNSVQEIDPMDQLKKLKDLLELGAISQAEFDEGKKSLLDKL
jgi:hypothetical protein